MPTSVMEISDFPAAATGSVILRLGSAAIGTAQEPGAIECPSDRAAMGGRPRTLTKVPFGKASGGPTRITSGICDAGSAGMVAETETLGRAV